MYVQTDLLVQRTARCSKATDHSTISLLAQPDMFMRQQACDLQHAFSLQGAIWHMHMRLQSPGSVLPSTSAESCQTPTVQMRGLHTQLQFHVLLYIVHVRARSNLCPKPYRQPHHKWPAHGALSHVHHVHPHQQLHFSKGIIEADQQLCMSWAEAYSSVHHQLMIGSTCTHTSRHTVPQALLGPAGTQPLLGPAGQSRWTCTHNCSTACTGLKESCRLPCLSPSHTLSCTLMSILLNVI